MVKLVRTVILTTSVSTQFTMNKSISIITPLIEAILGDLYNWDAGTKPWFRGESDTPPTAAQRAIYGIAPDVLKTC